MLLIINGIDIFPFNKKRYQSKKNTIHWCFMLLFVSQTFFFTTLCFVMSLMCCAVLFCRFLFSCINKNLFFLILMSPWKSRRACVFS